MLTHDDNDDDDGDDDDDDDNDDDDDELLDLAHLGVDQQVIGRLLLRRELHHKERKAQLGFTSASQLVSVPGRLKQAELNRSSRQ